MPLEYKEDWEATKQRYHTWWNGEYFGRCAVWVTAPLENPPDTPLPKMPEAHVERWTDLDFVAAQMEYHLSRTFYGGEAFPHWSPGYPGTGSIATFLGCPLHLDHSTGWRDPILTDDNWDIRTLQIDRQNQWWKFTLDWLKRGATEAVGKSIPSIGAFGGSGDTLAAVRGTLNLLYDIADTPEKVRQADEYLILFSKTVYTL